MKKEYVVSILFVFIITLFIISIISQARAEASEQEKVTKAYSWLINKTKNKWNNLNTKENVLSLLALNCNSTYTNQANSSLFRRSYKTRDIQCFGVANASSEQDCKITESAMAKVALDEIETNTTKINKWLLKNNKTNTFDVNWYLQIDVDRGTEATCEIYYLNQNESGFKINADKTVQLTGSHRCFSGVYQAPPNNYWFDITENEECLRAEYLVKCWSENATFYKVSLLYKKTGSTEWYVSAKTLAGVPGQGENEPQIPEVLVIPSYCLAESVAGASCNYEGTAWAAYAFKQQGDTETANLFVPYLILNKEENKGYFPSAFLSALIDSRYTTEAKRLQQPAGYWIIQLASGGVIYSTLYNTALGGLMLGENADLTKARTWLLGKQKTTGEFSDPTSPSEQPIRDNAFVLWVYWPQFCPGVLGGGCESNGPEFGCKESCDPFDEIEWALYSCPSGLACCENITGTAQDECVAHGGICAESCLSGTIELGNILTCPLEKSKCCKTLGDVECEADLGGKICMSGETCQDNETVQAGDGTCCVTSCTSGDTSGFGCSDSQIDGTICGDDEICWSYFSEEEVTFTPSLDGRCCTASCIKDKSCSDIGKDCSASPYGSGYSCANSNGLAIESVETRDVAECCPSPEGDCKKTCSQDKLCSEDETCAMWDITSTEPRCCSTECKKGGKSLWWIFIIIIVVIIAIVVYFFVIKKKPKKEDEEFPGFEEQESKGTGRKPPAFEFPTSKREFPIKPSSTGAGAIHTVRPSQQQPIRQIPIQKIEEKPARQLAMPVKQEKKTKAEEELEKTLEKLKKITKR